MKKLPIMLNGRELSKKEIRMLKEMTTTRGLVKSGTWLADHRYSKFIHEVFICFYRRRSWISNISKFETQDTRNFMCRLFDIPLDYYDRSRGQDQKLTYRSNRFEETIGGIHFKLNRNSESLQQDLLWIVDLHRLVEDAVPHPGTSRSYFLNTFLIVAKNALEADSLAKSLIAGPLGVNHSVSSVRVLGLPDFFCYDSHNAGLLSEMSESFDQDIQKAEELLQKSQENREKANYISAIISQASLMINGSI